MKLFNSLFAASALATCAYATSIPRPDEITTKSLETPDFSSFSWSPERADNIKYNILPRAGSSSEGSSGESSSSSSEGSSGDDGDGDESSSSSSSSKGGSGTTGSSDDTSVAGVLLPASWKLTVGVAIIGILVFESS